MLKKFNLVVLIFILFFSISTVYGFEVEENSYIVIDSETGATLATKNQSKKIYPASTTKILTCTLALENLNLSDTITVTKEMLDQVPNGSSTMKLVANDTLTVEDLLYGLMLPSGNDAAVVIAYLVSGNLDSFSELMNKKLMEIGCYNTHFVSPHGFHDDNHYSTPEDMAKLMQYAIKNEKFLEIISTKSYTLKANNVVTYDRIYANTNTLLNTLDYSLAGKTGYTSEAGNVFISYSNNSNKKIITALYDGLSSYYAGNYRFEDTKNINNYIFENFDNKILIDKNEINFKYIDKTEKTSYTVTNTDSLISLFKNDDYIVDYDILNTSEENLQLDFSIKYNSTTFNKILVSDKINPQKYSNFNISFSDIIVLISIIIDTCLVLYILLNIYKINLIKKTKKLKKIKKRYN